MLNEDFAYINDNLAFKYLGLKKYLLELHQMGINDVNLFLLISLEKEYYEGDNLAKIVNDLIIIFKHTRNLLLVFYLIYDSKKDFCLKKRNTF